MSMKRLLPRAAVKDLLGCGDTMYWDLLKAGELGPRVKLGAKTLVAEEHVEAYRSRLLKQAEAAVRRASAQAEAAVAAEA
jgi:hypothetical protein